ncbi:MAG: hypothetical protein M1838_003953 [Thelocarpon superellum]|nr:MAG: hypothetical protein M1838_003953 [Thelocarpon superellum]
MVRTHADWNPDRTGVEVVLAHASCECADLERLSGGYTNFTYQGTLRRPSPDGSKTVLIKHAKDPVGVGFSLCSFCSRASNFQQHYEHILLIERVPSVSHTLDGVTTTVRNPQSLHRFSASNVLATEFLPLSVKLNALLFGTSCTDRYARRVGTALGTWTRDFHGRGRRPEQSSLRQEVGKHQQAASLKYGIKYGGLETSIDLFPDLLAGYRDLVHGVCRRMKALATRATSSSTVIYGRKSALLPRSASEVEERQVVIIPWELCQISSIVFDLGQMLAELYRPYHFRNSQPSLVLIDEFLKAYGHLELSQPFDVLI